MFAWYRGAHVCLAFLFDVEHSSDQTAFRESVWFRRGWTLQELLASEVVIFLTKGWTVIGHKGNIGRLDDSIETGLNVELLISDVTKIPRSVLCDYSISHDASLDEKASWMHGRQTVKEEDTVYAMFGLFGVTPGAIYGEGRSNAWRRLRSAVKQKGSDDHEITLTEMPHRGPEHTSNLSRLITARGATYNSHEDEHTALCLEGTRIEIFQCIKSWTDSPHGKCIFWLCGKAGTGKTTIARTVGHMLYQSNRLAASFFFKRGESDRGKAGHFFSTILRQLIDKIPSLGKAVAAALDADSLLCEQSLQEQFEKLLQKPLSFLNSKQIPSQDYVIIVDALDECDRDNDIRTIINLLSRIGSMGPFRLRIFVTSRPELPIRLGFRSMNGDLHHDVTLEEVQAHSIRDDIHLYYEHRLEEIRSAAILDDPDALPPDWPGPDKVMALVDLAVPLFVVAFTVCRYVEEGDSRTCLENILTQKRRSSLSGLEEVYLPILLHKISGRTTQQRKQALVDFHLIVGTIILLANPLSIASLSALISLPIGQIKNTLKNLHSLLGIPPQGPVRLLHLSFRDFLVDTESTPAGEYHVVEADVHSRLTEQCLSHLECSGILRQDICSLHEPGIKRAEVDTQKIDGCIPAITAYACAHWAFHATQAGQSLCDGGRVHQFLESHLLHWLEALSWLGQVSSAIAHIKELRACVMLDKGVRLSTFLDDALRFVLTHRRIIDIAPLQLYYSVLMFTPTNSIVSMTFQHEASTNFTILSGVEPDWSLELQKLEGHNGNVMAVAFSHDSKLLASASHDGTVRVWSTETGEELQRFCGYHSRATSVSFSHNGKLLIAGFNDHTLRIWNVLTGEQKQEMRHDGPIFAVVFSNDSQLIASASWDKTARIWDASTGELMHNLIGHKAWVAAVSFSKDGRFLASASHDRTARVWKTSTGEQVKLLPAAESLTGVTFAFNDNLLAASCWDSTVQVWDAVSGEQIRRFRGHNSPVRNVSSSNDGTLIASVSDDRTARVWDVVTGKQGQKLIGHDRAINAAAFSRDDQMLATASFDRTVRIWRRTVHTEKSQRAGHDSSVSTLFLSTNGHIVASIAKDTTVRLWNVLTGEEMNVLVGHRREVSAVAFSHDDKLLASASWDCTLRIWDVATGIQRQELGVLGKEIRAMKFSPDGRNVVTISLRGVARKWNLDTGKEDRWMDYAMRNSSAIAFSTDSKLVALAWDYRSDHWSIDVRTLATGSALARLKGHLLAVVALAFSSDDELIASGSMDGTLRVWNIRKSREIYKFHLGPPLMLMRMQFSTDNRSIITDFGTFEIDSKTSAREHSLAFTPVDLHVRSEWLSYRGQDLLWLPHQHRANCFAVRGDTIVIGQMSGAVNFYRFQE